MAEQKLKAEPRTDSGKGVARKLRAAGRVPGVLYGHGMDPVPLAVDSKELYHVLHTGAGTNVLVGLVLNGENHLALPREIQRDYIRGRLLHVDFLAVRRDEKITVNVPVRVVGESPGVKQGGVLEHHLWDLHVECLPGDVPDGIDADISALDMNTSLKVSDISPPSGVTILTPEEETIVSVVPPQILRAIEELEAEEAAAAEAAAEEAAEAEGEEAPAAEEGGEAPAAEEGGEG